VAILAVVSLGLLSRGTTVDNFSIPGTQSQQALTQLQQALPALAAPSTQVVFASTSTAKLTGPAGRAAIQTSISRVSVSGGSGCSRLELAATTPHRRPSRMTGRPDR
jgi:RND superfamily putative drug exporter